MGSSTDGRRCEAAGIIVSQTHISCTSKMVVNMPCSYILAFRVMIDYHARLLRCGMIPDWNMTTIALRGQELHPDASMIPLLVRRVSEKPGSREDSSSLRRVWEGYGNHAMMGFCERQKRQLMHMYFCVRRGQGNCGIWCISLELHRQHDAFQTPHWS